MKRLTFLTLLIAAQAFPNIVRAELLKTDSEMGNIEITITGNKRTKSSYIMDLVDDCLEEESINSWKELEPETIEQCLLNSKIFSIAEVTVAQPSMQISLDERWTLLPIPYFYSSDDQYSVGFILMELNLFGRGKKAGVGGSFSSDGNSYFLFYRDPAVLFSDWSYSFSIGNTELEPVLEHDDIEYYSYESDEFAYELNVSREILLPDLWLSIGVAGNDKKYERVDSYTVPDDYDSYSLTTRIFYKGTDYKFYFNEGLQVNLDYAAQMNRSDENPKTDYWNLTIDWQKLFIKNNAIQLQLQLQEINKAQIGDALLVGGDKGFRGVQRHGLWVYRSQSISLDYQIPIKHYSYGTWTIAPFMDITQFDPAIDIPADSFIAGGLGGYLFLKDIALPGLGLLCGYNDEFDGFFVSFTLGMKF